GREILQRTVEAAGLGKDGDRGRTRAGVVSDTAADIFFGDRLQQPGRGRSQLDLGDEVEARARKFRRGRQIRDARAQFALGKCGLCRERTRAAAERHAGKEIARVVHAAPNAASASSVLRAAPLSMAWPAMRTPSRGSLTRPTISSASAVPSS